jgi:guanylate kinase
LLFVLSGPTGAGKTVLLRQLKALEANLYFCVTATTRPPRPGERDGVDYYFISQEEFARRVAEGGFLEWARVPPPDGPFYGTPVAEVERASRDGRDAFLQVDVQGAASVRAVSPGAVTIFLRPSSVDALQARVRQRGTETPDDMARRLANTRSELEHENDFDYSVVNDDGCLDVAVARVMEIVRAERARRWRADGGLPPADATSNPDRR